MRLVSENPAKQATQLLITWGEISRLAYLDFVHLAFLVFVHKYIFFLHPIVT